MDFNKLPEASVLTPEDLERLLPTLDGLIKWAKDVQQYALDQSMRGVKIKGWKVVEGRTIRKYSDPEKAVERCKEMGIPEQLLYEPPKVISVASMERLLGKTRFDTEIAPLFIDKGQGKPTLVEDSDPRPEFNLSSAEEDFKEILK